MSPEYFYDHLTVGEADDYLAGMERRQRPGWGHVRFLADVICKVLTGEDSGVEFPWDEPAVTEDEYEACQREMRAINARNRKRAGVTDNN